MTTEKKEKRKYTFKLPGDWISVNRWCKRMKVQNNLTNEEVDFFMSQKCVLCGSSGYIVIPLEKTDTELTAMNATTLCIHCYPPVFKMGIERFENLAFRISDNARRNISKRNSKVQGENNGTD